MRASNLHKPRPLWRLNPSQTSTKPAQTSLPLASESFSYKHQTCEKLTHSCVWILLMQASILQKTHSLLRLNPSHACIKPAQTSPTPASGSFSCEHQTCTNLTHSCVWILVMQAFNLHKPQPLCIWFLLIQASNLHKPHPLLRLNPSHAFIKPAHTSPFPASGSFSCEHQTCTNLTHSCVWILVMQAFNLHKPQPLCIWFLFIQASNLHKPHSFLRLNPSYTSKKPAQTSHPPASESLSCVHQTCTNLLPSCVCILIMRASDLHNTRPHQRLNPSHTSIKPAQTSTTPVSESLSCLHQTCTNLTHSCIWFLLIQDSNLHKPHPLLRLNPSHACIKHAQTSTTPASESVSYNHQTCTKLNHSCIWSLLIQASNLHKPHPVLRLNP